MMHVVEQTRDEKIAMYMKCRKRELAEMLTNANETIAGLTKPWEPVQESQTGGTTFTPPAFIAMTTPNGFVMVPFPADAKGI